MNLSLFDQFMSPILLYMPLIFISLMFPMLLISPKTPYWVGNRFNTLQIWFMYAFIKQLLLPLTTKSNKWATLMMSLLLLLMSVNLLGLLPYTFTPTTQLSMNLGLAVPLWLATVIMGLKNKTTEALGHLLPEGTPTLLIPALITIETISLLIRPLALGVRLTANLTAGHLLMHLISAATLIILSILPAAAALTMLVLLLLTILEIAVAMIQAYVFVLLLSLYLQENT
uniref:ATP synthase subunit a n=1 Tax=Bolitoglossa n. sp. RLM-2004 TaxID=291262 RepID=Q644A8_9SALA|nr:ATP synthase F0 subunit 6 [Bolitoglossa n. sp. RLM-2004]AAU20726.1 ATP synthase F0 subunit 6 [Bolitoglossa n. sp. RLM-2004]